MQFRELSSAEWDEGFALLSTLRPDLTQELFDAYLKTHFPHTYRPIGAYERGVLCLYTGVSIHENLELGRYLLIEDFVARQEYVHHSRQMIEFLEDYAKMHRCGVVVLWGSHSGLKMEDLRGFRPKRDGFSKTV